MAALHNCCDISAQQCSCGFCPVEVYQNVDIDWLNTKQNECIFRIERNFYLYYSSRCDREFSYIENQVALEILTVVDDIFADTDIVKENIDNLS